MTEQQVGPLPHLTVADRVRDESFHRTGGGGARVRTVDRSSHGGRLRDELNDAIAEADRTRADELRELTLDELTAQGVILVLEADGAAFPLRLDSLERMSAHRKTPRRPQWLLLSVAPADGSHGERAIVWVSDDYRAQFLQLFEEFLDKETRAGNPKNSELVANIATIRHAVLRDLWQSDGEPPGGLAWWEIWLSRTPDGLELMVKFATAMEFALSPRRLVLRDRSVVWLRARWDDLYALPFTAVPVTEIRRPEFVDTIEDLPTDEQDLLTSDLATRSVAASASAPAVCHFDTGVRRSHVLLSASLGSSDIHSVVDETGADFQGHGTLMAGLALYGSLDDALLSSGPVELVHRLESVKILPDRPMMLDPVAYGLVTAQAAASAEISAPDRRRVFCMPVTAAPEARPGEPSLWSASIDALSVGTEIGSSEAGIELISAPDPNATRLFAISAGNVRDHSGDSDYLDKCDTSAVEDPAHAWNALTVGAYTELIDVPSDPSFHGWSAMARRGDISPHSRTSLLFAHRSWPIKPDICMEGGNVLSNGKDYHEIHPLLSLRSTSIRNDLALASANATSAATAQAAGLAARAMAAYPSFWPETIRALLVHRADWTGAMKDEFAGATQKQARHVLLSRYGWGVPTEDAVLNSFQDSVALVVQDSFVPFHGPQLQARTFRLHDLPWPAKALVALADEPVEMRVTLSYFIEPTPSRRGWRRRYAYASHGLRFELKAPLETADDFIFRVNRDAQDEELGQRPAGGSDRWFIGSNQRNLGSLHQDVWEGTGAELAACNLIAVHPVGGWWKNSRRLDRSDTPVRYSLIVSLRTANPIVDLYTPISVQLPVLIDAT